jgi:nanoRNase/pAp phosphatase (c-di-AMP/oligoRNAs hydrolase)
MNDINKLIGMLADEKYIYIQTHNFPDHDAVASAYGLQELLKYYGIVSYLTYDGDIQRDSLVNMIEELDIDIKNVKEYDMKETDKIIIVDGCKGNKNITDLIGDEVAVIDHHQVNEPDDVTYKDIRPDYGSCSTIIYSYYSFLGKTIPKNAASAMLIGLNMDTALLTRGVIREDIDAYSHLYVNADVKLVNAILRNFIQVKDLEFYKKFINTVKIENNSAFCYFEEGCNQNMLGILGDFCLSLKEVEFVILCAKNVNKINFSLRSEKPEWNCGIIIQEVLRNIGFGGGHDDMAGGIINDLSLFDENVIHKKFKDILK